MTKKKNKGKFDENLFRAMNYEYAGEIGIIDNEQMKNNEKLITKDEEKDSKKK